MKWTFSRFDDLSPRDIHDLYQARVAVFVLEQKCPFQDVDGADPQCWHLIGRGDDAVVHAYSRLVPPGVKYPEPSIGRVLTTAVARRTGIGMDLMRESIAQAEKLWPGRALRIGAQRYLEQFYEGFGFATASAPYDEDGIMHVEMVRPAGVTAVKREKIEQR
ncbi:MAG TPA: GNAT family N-acetyltransferase [Usitatibacter sp.]|jgi:ElaA protein|nr:GNAT family N-acetyltransferase [Usitatibacter sp.]